MGVYIKGMEMPKNCSTCPFCFGANNICPWVMEYATCKGRHKDCPLVPVPPHGRLIDADALNESMARMVPWAIDDPTANAFLDGLSAAYEAIQAAPTVIEAEEGE